MRCMACRARTGCHRMRDMAERPDASEERLTRLLGHSRQFALSEIGAGVPAHPEKNCATGTLRRR
uniref:Uncharacterized protein n=1 Tax=Ralstonia solanacearum TaxID=305 RepID=A0A0S4VKA7_RALSL|nr:protein of unknown function [Ralstonia solanacearum]CUV22557.1 protein of unknown function [Ralstonia solanacearum]CUV31638.1 protein of unknown function [Ralstonia solanacearum]CUV34830.1 protein of unknown function [Ralstonia solanacearum]CUV37776.1 protein of unknown function [Ralstonia solanacearum]